MKTADELFDGSNAHLLDDSAVDPSGYAPFLPSCGFEMMQFYSDFCEKCLNPDEIAWREGEIPPGCHLIVQATAENKQPIDWVVKDGAACCLHFQGV